LIGDVGVASSGRFGQYNTDRKASEIGTETAVQKWNSATPSVEERQQQKRDILIREAGAAFGRNGFHHTTLEEVASNIGITKAAIYYYFQNKNEILFECHKLAIRVAGDALELAETRGQTGYEKLCLTIRCYIVGLTSELSYFSILVDVSDLEPQQREYVVQYRDKFEVKLRRFVKEGILDGSIAPCDPKFAIFVLMGAVSWVPSWYSPTGKLSGEKIADKLIEIVSRGILPRS